MDSDTRGAQTLVYSNQIHKHKDDRAADVRNYCRIKNLSSHSFVEEKVPREQGDGARCTCGTRMHACEWCAGCCTYTTSSKRINVIKADAIYFLFFSKRAECSTVHNYTVEARQDRVLCMVMGKEERRNVRRPATGLNGFISRLIASPNTNPPQVKVLFLLLVNGISKSTAQRNTQVVKCGLPVDFGFLWDESGSIGAANFRQRSILQHS